MNDAFQSFLSSDTEILSTDEQKEIYGGLIVISTDMIGS